jgi:hypothetical protein
MNAKPSHRNWSTRTHDRACVEHDEVVGFRGMARARSRVRDLENRLRELDRMIGALDRHFGALWSNDR